MSACHLIDLSRRSWTVRQQFAALVPATGANPIPGVDARYVKVALSQKLFQWPFSVHSLLVTVAVLVFKSHL